MDGIEVSMAIGEAAAVALASFAMSWAVARLGVAIALRRFDREAHRPWYERAALADPARRACAWSGLLNAIFLGEVAFFRIAPGLGLPPAPLAAMSGLCGLMGAIAVGRRLERRLRESAPSPSSSRPARRGIALVWVMHVPLYVTVALMVAAIPGRWGWPAVAVLASGSLLLACHAAGLSLLALRPLGLLRPASPRLREIVDRTATLLGIRPRATYELDSPDANALAWFVPGFLVFTTTLCDVLDDDELAGIAAHELGHLAEPWAVYLTRVASVFLLVALVAIIPVAATFGLTASLAMMASITVALIALRKMGRRMEVRSDRLACERGAGSGAVFARALEKIYEANLVPVVSRGKRRVHPHLYDRLIASGISPAYPRPAPPRLVLLSALPAIAFATACLWQSISGTPLEEEPVDRPAPVTDMAEAGDRMLLEGDLEGAAQLYERAADLYPYDPRYPARLATTLVSLEEYDEAEGAADRAEVVLSLQDRPDPVAGSLVRSVRKAIESHRQSQQADDTGGRGSAAPADEHETLRSSGKECE